jgi:hypothetical protein
MNRQQKLEERARKAADHTKLQAMNRQLKLEERARKAADHAKLFEDQNIIRRKN